MTDRYNALTVVLDHDIRSDDAEVLVSAIKQLRGVLNVIPNVVENLTDEIAEARVRQELSKKLWAVLHGEH